MVEGLDSFVSIIVVICLTHSMFNSSTFFEMNRTEQYIY